MTRPSRATFGRRRWWQPVVAILLAALTYGWSQQSPDPFSAPKTVVLNAAKASPEKGQAYWIPLHWIAPTLASDKEDVSSLVLFEDDEQLTGHAQHADIRKQAGLYSHWGMAILFSSRDGSDPRTNGRRYEIHIPPTPTVWHLGARIALLITPILLLLIWLHGVIGGSPVTTAFWALGGTAVLGLLVTGIGLLSSPAQELRAIRKAVSETASEPQLSDSAAPKNARTRHLLRRKGNATFITDASPPTARQPRAIALRPTQGTKRGGGYTELGDGVALRNVEPLDIAASELELMVLELTVTQGTSLTLRLSDFEGLDTLRRSTAAGKEPRARFILEALLSFPVTPSPKPQVFQFRRPALGPTNRVRHVSIQRDPNTSEIPIVRVESLRYALRLDAFTEQHSGFTPVDLGGSLRPAFWQSVRGHFSLPLAADDGSLLKLAVGAVAPSEVPIDFAVSVVHRDGRHSALHQGVIAPHDGWHELALSLPEDAKGLWLEGNQVPPGSVLLWSGARVIDTERSPERLVLIVADTLRADALGCYGHEGDPTPALDNLAREGTRFRRAFSQTYWTRPSMASIMTGRYVAATGVQTLNDRLPETYETLAERLASGGFTTVAIVTNTNAGPVAGLDQGFDRFRLKLSLTSAQSDQTDRLITEVVLPTLSELGEDDVFLYLHLLETHGPYGPSKPPGPDFQWPTTGTPLPHNPHLDRPWNQEPTTAQRVALYDYDVRSMDRALGELFAHLDQHWRSPEGPPILAFVSDHGEHLGERSRWGHEFADLYPENVQVPLIIRAPGRISPDTVVPGPVEIRHLGATLLDLVGLAPDAETDDSVATWRSLLPLLENGADLAPPPFAVSAADESDRAAFSLFGQRYGYVARFLNEKPKIAIFSDSKLDRQVTAPWRRPVLKRVFLRMRRSHRKSQTQVRDRLWVGMEDTARTIDREELEQLKALGYIQD